MTTPNSSPTEASESVLETARRIYLDLDGVMADFDAHFPATFGLNHRDMADDAMWQAINGHPSYFRDMPPCAGAVAFFRSIEHLRPIILTACPKSNYPHVARQKRAWVREHLSEHVTVLPVLGGRHKPLFMQEPGDVLIDDWSKNVEAWEEAGGVGILHRSFGETAAALAALQSVPASPSPERIAPEGVNKAHVFTLDHLRPSDELLYGAEAELCRRVATADTLGQQLVDQAALYAVRTMLASAPSPEADPAGGGERSQAAQDVLAERKRQVEVEGWTAEHDDYHADGSLATAAGCYAFMGGLDYFGRRRIINEEAPYRWPWSPTWWKPVDNRRDLVKAGALILAEIERLDRPAPAPSSAPEE